MTAPYSIEFDDTRNQPIVLEHYAFPIFEAADATGGLVGGGLVDELTRSHSLQRSHNHAQSNDDATRRAVCKLASTSDKIVTIVPRRAKPAL